MIPINKIPNRILSLATLIDDGSVVADIGCDHAYLLIYLAYLNKIKKGYAIDNKIGPINNAKKNINDAKVDNIIDVRNEDGINNLQEDVDTLVLAGMGGFNIIDIISNHLDKISNVKTIILDAHNARKEVRLYLRNIGYDIVEQLLIKEGNIFYQLDKFIKKDILPVDDISLYLGHTLLNNNDELYKEYLLNIKNNLEYKLQFNKDKETIIESHKILERIKLYFNEN